MLKSLREGTMRLLFRYAVLLSVMVQMIAGCGGGGGGSSAPAPPSTKTVTLKFSSQSTSVGVLFSGFDLTVTLPAGSVLLTDASGVPAPSAVYLSGQFAGAVPQNIDYNGSLRKLTVSYISVNDYYPGEFMTIVFTVPTSYVPNTSDISSSFSAWDLNGVKVTTVTASPAFN